MYLYNTVHSLFALRCMCHARERGIIIGPSGIIIIEYDCTVVD